jgi:hypothetical protein
MKDKRKLKSEIRVVGSSKPIKRIVDVQRVNVRLDTHTMTFSELAGLSQYGKDMAQLLKGFESVMKNFQQHIESIGAVFLNIQNKFNKIGLFSSSLSRGVVIFDSKLLDRNTQVIQGMKLGEMLSTPQVVKVYKPPQSKSRYIDYELNIIQYSNKLDSLHTEVSLLRQDLKSMQELNSKQLGNQSWSFDSDTNLLDIGGIKVSFLSSPKQRKLLEAINSNKSKKVWAIDEIIEVMEDSETAYDNDPKYWDKFLRQTARNIMVKLNSKGFRDSFIEYKDKTLIIPQIGS